MNKVMLIGNVGQDPEVRYVDQGVAVARLRLATTERGYTLQNGTQVPDHTDYMYIKAINCISRDVFVIPPMMINRVSVVMLQKYGPIIWNFFLLNQLLLRLSMNQ